MIPFSDIEKWAEKFWPKVLKAELTGESLFPQVVRKKAFPPGLSPGEKLAILDEVRGRAKVLIGPDEHDPGREFGYTCYLAESGRDRKDRIPHKIEFATLEDYLGFIGRESDFATFRALTARILRRFPEVGDWLSRNALKILELESDWDSILSVLEFFLENPRPDLYLRELQLPVDTKFIERNERLFDCLLEIVLPDEAIDHDEGIFERKYGLQWVEPLIRVCFLDPQLKKDCCEKDSDFGLPVRTLASRSWPVDKVLVIENLTSLVSLKDRGLSGFLGLHGHGYRVANFEDLVWLHDCDLYYWGDIDVQGFEILSLFRRKFPHAKSILMGEETIEATPDASKGVGKPSRWKKEPRNLTQTEFDAYCWARNGWRQIEQEHISMEDMVVPKLKRILGG